MGALLVVPVIEAVEIVGAVGAEAAIVGTEATVAATEVAAAEAAAAAAAEAAAATEAAVVEEAVVLGETAAQEGAVAAEEAIVQEGGVLGEGAIDAAAEEEGAIVAEEATATEEEIAATETRPGIVKRVLRHPVVRGATTALNIYTVGEMGYDIGACEENWTDSLTGHMLRLQDINPNCRPRKGPATPGEGGDETKEGDGPLRQKAPVYNEDAAALVVPTHRPVRKRRREITYEYPVLPVAALLAVAAVVSARA
jgi:hypothetical protein